MVTVYKTILKIDVSHYNIATPEYYRKNFLLLSSFLSCNACEPFLRTFAEDEKILPFVNTSLLQFVRVGQGTQIVCSLVWAHHRPTEIGQ